MGGLNHGTTRSRDYGKACLAYTNWLADVVGKIKDQQLTSEYYEPETKARINIEQDLRRQE
jgi:hypothetical protein